MFKQTNKTNLNLSVTRKLSQFFGFVVNKFRSAISYQLSATRFLFFLVALTGVFLYTRVGTPTHVQAATSSNLNFQARLLTGAGSIVPDGTYNVEFKIYNSSTVVPTPDQGACTRNSGTAEATCLWTETRTGANKVSVRAGYLSVSLGSVTALPNINWNQDLWLVMNIGGSGAPSWDGEMTPRLKLTAVPYALSAGNIAAYNGTQTGTLGFNTVLNSPDIKLPDIAGTNNVLLQSGTTNFTQGSVPFTDSTGRLTQNNANFYFDNTSNTLGVGTTRTGAIDGTGNARVVIQGSGSTSATSALNIRNSSGSGSLLLVRDDGNVGIGTSSPTSGYKLDVAGNAILSGGSRTLQISDTGCAQLNFQNSSNNINYCNNQFAFTTNQAQGFNFTGGNVGIGTSTIGTNNRLIVNPYSTVDNLATAQVNTNAATNKGLVVQGFASQSADLLQLQDSSGNINAKFNATGNQLTLGRIAASGTVTAGSLLFGDGTIDNFSSTLQAATQTANTVYQLPAASAGTYAICTSANNCSGLGAYIQNNTSLQSPGNFAIQSVADGSVTGLIRARASQTADLLQFQNSGGTQPLSGINSTGSIYFRDSTSGFTSTLSVTAGSLSASNKIVTLPNAGGELCTSSGNCIGNGGSGDVFKNGQTGPLVLGTNDAGGSNLSFITQNITRATFDYANNLYLGNGATNASPNNFVLQGTGSATAGTAGALFTIKGGAGATTTTGGVGGGLTLQGGDAGGSGVNNGGSVNINGGAKTSTGTVGYVILQGTNGGNVGIGTTAPGYKLDVNGTANFAGAATTTAGGAAGVGTNLLATTNYVQSRAENLVTNGSGTLFNNYNFSGFTFDATETYSGGGSFKYTTPVQAAKFNDEFIPVDPSKNYILSGWAKSGDTGGANYNASNVQYLGVSPLDIDGFIIVPNNYAKYPGSTDTTLAAALNPGDTTITLANASGWHNGATAYQRNFVWYGYTNSKGYTYPNYTYTRNTSYSYSSNSSLGAWSASGISGNTITLRVPWAGPALASGAAVRNSDDGGTYKYIAASGVNVPNAWTNYSGNIGGLDVNGTQNQRLFPYGTAYINLLFLLNYPTSTGNTIRWSNLSFSNLSAVNLEVATATQQGVVSTAAQTFGGNKTIQGSASSWVLQTTDGTVTSGLYDGTLGTFTGAVLGTTSNHPLGFTTNGNTTPQVTLQTNGNLGVKANNALSVASDILGTLTVGTPSTTGSSLFVNTPSLNTTFASGLAVNGTYSNPGGVGTSVVNLTAYGVQSAGGYDSALAFSTGLNGVQSEKLRVTSAGNVGIGTTSPGSKLTVEGVSLTAGSFQNGSNGIAAIQGDAYTAGDVIPLDFKTNDASSAPKGRIALRVEATGSYLQFGTSNSYASGITNTALTIDPSGNIGIGTTAPAEKLHVYNGNAQIDYGNLKFTTVAAPGAPTATASATAGNPNGTYTYGITFVTAQGETSLGTASASVAPASKQVNLTAIPTGTSGVVTGRKIYRTLAGGTTYYYVATLADNTTTTYTDNTADASLTVVVNAINTTGGRTFLNGVQTTLFDANSANTGLGIGALSVNTSGTYNTATGYVALSSNTTGINNVANGALALQTNSTGNYNNAIGSQALVQNSSGSYNSANGYAALYYNSTGNGNVGNGLEALFYNKTGNYNTASGYAAGFGGAVNNSDITGNSLFGYNAGGVLLTGANYNTLLGYNAGGTLTTGARNILIGQSVQASSITGSDQLNIGNAIYGDLATGKIGIGATTPGKLLSVGGTTGNFTVDSVGSVTIGASAGSGTLLTNNGSTINSTLALGDFATGGSIGTAAATVDIYTAVSVAQTTAGQTLTLPTPTASTAYGRLLYISNIGTTGFTLLGSTLNAGSTATLVWSNTNGGAAWTFAGADGSAILNQNSVNQTANYRITGTGQANGGFLAPSIDVAASGTLSLGTAALNTAITLGRSGITTTNAGALTVTQASQFNGNTTLGASAGSGTLLTNNGATVNTTLALGNFATGGAIGTAAATVDIYTSVSVAQTTAAQTLTIPTPTASTTYGRLLYIANIGTTSFTVLGTTLNAGSTATLMWTNTNGAASWTFAGADGSAILNQSAVDQSASFRITGTGRANTSILTPLVDGIGAGTLGIGTATTGNLSVGNNTAGGSNSTTIQAATGGVTIQTAVSAGSGNTGNINIQTGNAASGSNNTSGSISIKSGDASGGNASSGGIAIDVGAKTGTGTAGSITIGTGTNAPAAITISKVGVLTTIQGGLTLGSSAGSGTLLTNNGATVNTTLALGNFATGGAIGTAAATIDIYTSISVAQTTASQTLTIPTPTASTTYGRLAYISNIGTTGFTLLGSTLNAGATATIMWANTNGGAAWTYAGADGSSIINQNSADQTANFRITGTGRANTSFVTPLVDAVSASLGIGTTGASTTALSVGNTSATFTLESNGTANLFNGATAHTIAIGTGGAIQGITLGSSGNFASTTAIQGGNGATAITLTPQTTGGIVVGAVAGTGSITVGSSSATQSVLIGNGAGISTVNIANATTAGANVNIAGAATATGITDTINIGTGNTVGTGAKVIHIGDGTPAGTNTVTIGSIAATANVTTIQGGNGATAINLQAAASGSINIGTNAVTGKVVNIGSVGSTANASTIHIGDSTDATAGSIQGITIGSNSNLAHTTAIQGGNGATAITLTPQTTGGIVVGAAAGTGSITVGSSSAGQSVLIANGAGAPTVNIANVSVAGATVSIAGAANTSANTISIANGASAANSTVNILSGVGTAGAGDIHIGNNTRVNVIDLGNIAPAAARTTTIAGGNSGVVDTLNIATGNTTIAGGKTVHIGDGTPTGTNLITIGSIAATANTTTIQGGNGATAINLQAASSGSINIGTGTNRINLGTSAGSGTLFTNNGATVNATLAVLNDSDGGALGGTPGSPLTAAQSVDIYTAISVAQTTAGQTITLPTPTANTTYGRVLYLSNIGTVSFTILGSTLNAGSTATFIWSNTNGAASWQYAGADGNAILNQITSDQSANFRITGTGRANTSILTPLLDTASSVPLDIGNSSSVLNLNQNTTVAANKNFTINTGTGVYSQTYNGTGNALSVTSSSTTDLNKAINIAQTGATAGTDYAGYFVNTGAGTTNVGLYSTATGATNNYAAIFDQGNVGIGTTAPQLKLALGTSSDFGIEMSPPTSVNAALGAGGTLTAGTTYYYKITALDYIGETIGSSEVSATPTSGNQTINLSWATPQGAGSQRIYRSTTSGVYTSPAYIGTSYGTTFSDTGIAASAGTVPTVTSAYVSKISGTGASWLNSGGNLSLNAGPNAPAARLSFGTLLNTAAIHLYAGGATANYGFGIRPAEMQSFIPTSAHYSFNAGGDLQASGTNELVRIQGDGKVGIGTASPTQKLEVVGTTKTDDLITKGPWRDVRAYGATGDGSTDDTTAINNAIAAIPASGGTLYFAPGTYITTALTIAGDGTKVVNVVGAGADYTVLKLKNATNAALLTVGSTSDVPGFVMKDLTIDGNKTNQTSATDLLDLQRIPNGLLDHVVVRNSKAVGIGGSGFGYIEMELRNVRAENNTTGGIQIDNVRAFRMNGGGSFSNGNGGVRLTKSSGTAVATITGTAIENNTGAGIEFNALTMGTAVNNYLRGNGDSVGSPAIHGFNSSYFTAVGNTIEGGSGNGIDNGGAQVVNVTGNTVKGISGAGESRCFAIDVALRGTVSNNVADSCGDQGILAYNSSNLTIEGNTVTNNGQQNATHSQGHGIRIWASTASIKNISVLNNTIVDTQGTPTQVHGINIRTESTFSIDGLKISGNTLRNNVSNGITFEGAGTTSNVSRSNNSEGTADSFQAGTATNKNALLVNSAGNVVIQGSTSDNTASALNVLNSGGSTSLLQVRNDGVVATGNVFNPYAINGGDLSISRTAAPTTGAIFFGNDSAAAHYLYYNGSNNFDLTDSLTVTAGSITTTRAANNRLAVISTGAGNLAGIKLTANSNSWYLDNRGTIDTPNNRVALFNNGGAEVLTALTGGNVGINVNNPGSKLDVGGDINTSGYYRQGTAVVLHQTGGNDLFVGNQAGTLTTTGTQNTGVGYAALSTIAGGANNTAFGYCALCSQTTANGNTALGSGALSNVLTGGQNTAVGDSALGATLGTYNTAVGELAGNTNTTGTNNTLLGSLADVSSINLTNATAIGYNAKVATSNSLVLGGTGTYAVNVGIGTIAPVATFHTVGTGIIQADSATAFQVQNAAGASAVSVDTTNTNSSLNLAVNGGAETSGTFATNWTAQGAATVTRDTTATEFASGLASVKAATTAANHGAKNNLGAALAINTTYIVSFSIKAGTSAPTNANLSVIYQRDGAATDATCSSFTSAINPVINTSSFIKYTCTFTTSGTVGNTSAAIAIQQLDAVTRSLFIDNFSIVAQNATGTQNVGTLRVGGASSQGLTLLTLDTSAGTPFTGTNTALVGSMYFDTTSGKIQCYDGSVWGACGAAPNGIVTITPEYAGAVLNGTGIGTLTSDFCGNGGGLSVNIGLCASGEARNFYKWTSIQSSAQTYSMYVTYKLPSTFKNFVDNNTISLTAHTDNTTNGIVAYELYKSTGTTITACGTSTTVTSSTVGWQTVPHNGNENTTCAFAANNYVIFKITVTASNSANVYVENLNFAYTNQ